MSSTPRMNAVEKDLEKFIKFLALKATQVVVQSRLSEKMITTSNPLSKGNDWFNIIIDDHPDVSADTKRALALGGNITILQRLPLCVEISLKTVEGDKMVLEVWSLECLTQRDGRNEKGSGASLGSNSNSAATDQHILRASHAIYNRMGMLLKSLITLTRTTPAYKLSRRQCPDSFGIFYRIYVGLPQTHNLGEGQKCTRIGNLNTIVGILSIAVSYRTKLTITPTAGKARNSDKNIIMLKSDHFRPGDVIPTQLLNSSNGIKKNGFNNFSTERKIIDIEQPLKPGAFAEIDKIPQYTEEDFILPETPPFEWLLQRTRHESGGSSIGGGSIESLNRKSESPAPTTSPLGNGYQHNINNNASSSVISNNNNNIFINNNNINNNSTAFKSLENDENSRKSPTPSITSQSPIKSLLIPIPPVKNHNTAPIIIPNDDDNLLKELHFPFASPSSRVNDLAKFYRDCYHAPPLRGLNQLEKEKFTSDNTKPSGSNATAGGAIDTSKVSSSSSTDDDVDDLSRQLEIFETSLEDYDKLVSQFGLSGSTSTGSRSSGGGVGSGLQMSN